MTAKEYLNQARTLDRHINYKLAQIQQLRELSEKATSTYIAERVSGTPQRSRMANCVERMVDLEKEIETDIDRLVDLKRSIRKIIASVPNEKQRMVLELRYLNGYTWEKVAVESGCTFQWVHILHGRALKRLSPVDCN